MAAGVAYEIDEGILPPREGMILPVSNLAQMIVAVGALLGMASLAGLAPRTEAGRRIERAGGWAAAFSYTLYLVHYPVLTALSVCVGLLPAVMSPVAVLRALCWVAVSVAVTLGMYALFERQTPRVRRWLRARLGGPVPARLVPAPGLADVSGPDAPPVRMIRA